MNIVWSAQLHTSNSTQRIQAKNWLLNNQLDARNSKIGRLPLQRRTDILPRTFHDSTPGIIPPGALDEMKPPT